MTPGQKSLADAVKVSVCDGRERVTISIGSLKVILEREEAAPAPSAPRKALVRWCARCAAEGIETTVTAKQSAASVREFRADLCGNHFEKARQYRANPPEEREALRSQDQPPAVADSGGSIMAYSHRLKRAQTVLEVNSVVLDLTNDQKASPKLVETVRGLAKARTDELAAGPAGKEEHAQE